MAMNEEGRTASSERLIPVGKIVGTHGVGGLLRLHPYSDSAAVLAAPRTVYLDPKPRATRAGGSSPPRTATLTSARPHGRIVLIRLEDVATIDAATPFVGTVVSLAEHDLPAAAPGEYYAYQLEGLEVVTSGGDRLGTVDHLFPTGSNEVLVVRDGEREHLIPVIADVVRRVDLVDRRIVIEPIEGLLD